MYPIVKERNWLLDVAEQNHWDDCMLVGRGEMIDEPMVVNGWYLTPADQYNGVIPTDGMLRLYYIINSGFKIKGVLVADDLRSLNRKPALPAPQPQLPDINWRFVFETAIKIISGLAVAVVAAVVISVLAALLVIFGAAALILGAVGTVLVYDPMLIVITEDDEWVAVYMWLD